MSGHTRSTAIAGFCLVFWGLSPEFSAFAQPPELQRTTSSSAAATQTPAQICGPPPYIVETQEEIQQAGLRLQASFLKSLSSRLPAGSGSAVSVEAKRSMVRAAAAGMAMQAVFDVMNNYACRIEAAYGQESETSRNALKSLKTFRRSWVENAYGPEIMTDRVERQKFSASIDALEDTPSILPRARSKAAIGDNNFILISQVTKSLEVNAFDWGGLSVCEGFIKKSLRGSPGSVLNALQHVDLAVANWLDGKRSDAADQIYSDALAIFRSNNVTGEVATVDLTPTMKSCMTDAAERAVNKAIEVGAVPNPTLDRLAPPADPVAAPPLTPAAPPAPVSPSKSVPENPPNGADRK